MDILEIQDEVEIDEVKEVHASLKEQHDFFTRNEDELPSGTLETAGIHHHLDDYDFSHSKGFK